MMTIIPYINLYDNCYHCSELDYYFIVSISLILLIFNVLIFFIMLFIAILLLVLIYQVHE